jgi:hypothetical protein
MSALPARAIFKSLNPTTAGIEQKLGVPCARIGGYARLLAATKKT